MPDSGDGQESMGNETETLRRVKAEIEQCIDDLGKGLLPGPHFLYLPQHQLARYGAIRGSHYAVAPAGSIFLTVYSIWHRRSVSHGTGIRNNLKYNYRGTMPPERDWVKDPDFDLAMADFSIGDQRTPTFRDQFRDCYDAAGMYAWLSGASDGLRLMGGQGWPLPPHRWRGGPYGVPSGLSGG